MNATPDQPNIVMGQRPDGTPWVIGVDFDAKVSIGAQGELLADRKRITVDEARARAAALLAAADWIESGRSAQIEAQ